MLDRVTQSLNFLGQGLGLDAQGDMSVTTTGPVTTEESAGDSSSSSTSDNLPSSLSHPHFGTTLPPPSPSSPSAASSPVLKGVLKNPSPPSSPVARGRGPGSFTRSASGRLTAGVDSLVGMLFGQEQGLGPGLGPRQGSSLPASPVSRLRSSSSPSSSPPSTSPQGSPKTRRQVTFLASTSPRPGAASAGVVAGVDGSASPGAGVVSDEACENTDWQQQQQQQQQAAHEHRLSSLLGAIVDIDLDAAAAAAFNVNRFPFR